MSGEGLNWGWHRHANTGIVHRAAACFLDDASPVLVLTPDELARRESEAAEKALRDAAGAWTQGQWSDVMLPKPSSRAMPVIAYSNRIGDWLRARADSVAQGREEGQ